MKVSNAARGLLISVVALFSSGAVTMASQTYVLRAGAARREEPHGFQSRSERIVPNFSAAHSWIIDDRYEIDDPDFASAGSQGAGIPANSMRAVEIARMYQGARYVWGGVTSRGFDCSGFVRYVYARLGHRLPRTAREQFNVGRRVAFSQMLPGDILFFHTSRRGVSHVGIYIGNHQFIHAANPRMGVTVSSLSGYYGHRLLGARRID